MAALVIPVENHYAEASQEKCLRFCPKNSREEVCFSFTEFPLFTPFFFFFLSSGRPRLITPRHWKTVSGALCLQPPHVWKETKTSPCQWAEPTSGWWCAQILVRGVCAHCDITKSLFVERHTLGGLDGLGEGAKKTLI